VFDIWRFGYILTIAYHLTNLAPGGKRRFRRERNHQIADGLVG
jgi:hypothetical protein